MRRGIATRITISRLDPGLCGPLQALADLPGDEASDTVTLSPGIQIKEAFGGKVRSGDCVKNQTRNETQECENHEAG